ncbi:MAG: LysE family translocator [Pseudomonadota bacterium]
MTPEFIITALVVALIPGTGVIYTVATAMLRGRAQGVAAAFGCTLGIIPAMLASIAGVAAILHTSAILFTALKYVGAAYLLYLAWKVLTDDGPVSLTEAKPDATSTISVVWLGFLLNILNPKLSAFFLALLPQFVDPNTPGAVVSMLGNGFVFMLVTFVVFVGYAALASLARERVLRSAGLLKWMRRTVALSFAAFSVRLAMADR